ncbi:hypothetical protein CJP72_24055 [Citrobacter sp. NCU1]|uniref:hypothetical protein n=1 Tax=Citrobacter sp. NCU1 TaxID=2026683 RepID=UPI001390C714|nr:hypothetical protein [Citrobacter sp. NCU1]NDO83705.1 hypothetical protein [Citrobacter sp. NCU1]
MKEVMMAIDDLEAAQIDLLKRWLQTYNTMEQQNQLLSQQVDYLENKIAELEQKLLEDSRCPLIA